MDADPPDYYADAVYCDCNLYCDEDSSMISRSTRNNHRMDEDLVVGQRLTPAERQKERQRRAAQRAQSRDTQQQNPASAPNAPFEHADGYNPNGNSTAKQTKSSKGFWLAVNNFPPDQRFKLVNLFYLGSHPPPTPSVNADGPSILGILSKELTTVFDPGLFFSPN
ncbi:hypothetical protein HMN09_01410900 [Mycena chlorophos]|uniref:Uncharacterized protein n=1 Tax=Mycena chlorophos TaxID=658473 RepID=A0A8H6RWP0_MYCCL|nr:hypothetical protein HMN09_01410900 [Mycena chlorophos]